MSDVSLDAVPQLQGTPPPGAGLQHRGAQRMCVAVAQLLQLPTAMPVVLRAMACAKRDIQNV